MPLISFVVLFSSHVRCGRGGARRGRGRLSRTSLVTLSCRRGHWGALLADFLFFWQAHRRILVLRAGHRFFWQTHRAAPESLAYFKDNPQRLDWEFVFVVTAIVGGAIAALTGGDFANE